MGEEAVKHGVRSKLAHEFKEMLLISCFFGLFFFSFATYKMYLLHEFRSADFSYTSALINTLVLAKVVLLGGFLKAGRRMEHMPLLISSIYKAAFFALLVGAFHWIEEFVKAAIHGAGVVDAFHETLQATSWPLLGLVVISFCMFIPFFALWEIRRVMGEESFTDLFVRRKNATITVSQ